MERLFRRADSVQQKHGPASFVFGVIKKFGDDNAGSLVSNLAHSAFGAVFPLLLLLVTVLGIVLRNDAGLRNEVLHSTLSQFPVIGNQLGRNIHALQRGSSLALTVSLLWLVWSSTGLAQAGLFTMEQVWNVPGTERPNYPRRLVRSLGFLAVMALGLAVTTGLASAGIFGNRSLGWVVLAELAATVVNVGQFFLAFRVLTPKAVETRKLWPGAVAGGICWTLLQVFGGYLVAHDLRNASEVYGTFAIVLGLLAWVYLGCEVSVYAAELNTVIARRLWPRGIVQPPLTEADQRSIAAQAYEERRRPEEEVEVSFTEPAMTQEEHLEKTGGEKPG